MWSCGDNQEVGLEAATLERVLKSSLVKWFCADNLAGLKQSAEAVSFAHVLGFDPGVWMGRGASCAR